MRPVAELELMDERELGNEASQTCGKVLIVNKAAELGRFDGYQLAHRYLRTIGLVLRKKNGGVEPGWYMDILQASSGKNMQACFDPWKRQSEKEMKQKIAEIKRKGRSLDTFGEQLRIYNQETDEGKPHTRSAEQIREQYERSLKEAPTPK